MTEQSSKEPTRKEEIVVTEDISIEDIKKCKNALVSFKTKTIDSHAMNQGNIAPQDRTPWIEAFTL